MTPKIVALTIGDPNGIGPEIAVKAAMLCAEAQSESRPILVGDEHVIRFYADKFAPGRPLMQGGPSTDKQALLYHPVAALDAKSFQPGQGSAEAGRATVAYVGAALDLATRGRAHSIVACPHSETNVNSAGIKFSGYPSLLARLKKVSKDEVFLMLVGAGLRIVHVTLHERLFDALNRITPTLIERAIRTTIDALRNLGIPHPRLGVFGINPTRAKAVFLAMMTTVSSSR